MARDRLQELLETTNDYLERARRAEAAALTYRAALCEIWALPSSREDEGCMIAKTALIDGADAIGLFRSVPATERMAMIAEDRLV